MCYFSKLKVILVTTLVLITGCSADIKSYSQTTPTFALFDYFEGESQAWGMIQDRSGQQMRRFHVLLSGEVEDNVLTLNEDFTYDDGEKSTRIWVIERLPDGTYQGKADDIIGVAVGEEQGNALRWEYDFELPYDGSTIKVSFDDWLYRQDEKHLFNRTSITKFGVEVATLTLFFQK